MQKSTKLFVATLLVAISFSATVFAARQIGGVGDELTPQTQTAPVPDGNVTYNSQGPEGQPGMDGQNGQSGPQGNQGPQGQPGYQGRTGPQGPRGNHGSQGNRGNRGYQGARGSRGPQGSQGPQGKPGVNTSHDGVYKHLMTWDVTSKSYVDGRDGQVRAQANAYTDGAIANVRQTPQTVNNVYTTTPAMAGTNTGNAGGGSNAGWITLCVIALLGTALGITALIITNGPKTAAIAQQANQTNQLSAGIALLPAMAGLTDRKVEALVSAFPNAGGIAWVRADNSVPPAPVAPVQMGINPHLLQKALKQGKKPAMKLVINDPATAQAYVNARAPKVTIQNP